MPLISVLTTSYNRENYLEDSVRSVLASDFKDFELIIVDDCSTDHTFEVALALQKLDDRIKVYRNEKNLGDYPNRARAASLASSEYLKYVDSDDVIYPHCLRLMYEAMRQYPEAGLGLSTYAGEKPFPFHLTSVEAYRAEARGFDLFGRAPGSAMIKKIAYDAVGGFSGKRQVGDFEFWARIAARFSVVAFWPYLLWDRTIPGQEKQANSDAEKYRLRLEIWAQALLSKDCPLPKDEALSELARYVKRGKKEALRKLLFQRKIQDAYYIAASWNAVKSRLPL